MKLSVLGQLICVQKSGPVIPVNLKHSIVISVGTYLFGGGGGELVLGEE